MQHRAWQKMTLAVAFSALLFCGACDRLMGISRDSAKITKEAMYEVRDTWLDVFTYHPPKPYQLPQSRYCYQAQSDIVCYDSLQPQLTSKLLGYQDGDAVAWFQPGGGSLGASGGPAYSYGKTELTQNAPGVNAGSSFLMPTQGQIQSSNLEPVTLH